MTFDYQSDRHCAKTYARTKAPHCEFDYQSDRHCAKTGSRIESALYKFDYQSDRHCAKTHSRNAAAASGLITSQIDTAPKQRNPKKDTVEV